MQAEVVFATVCPMLTLLIRLARRGRVLAAAAVSVVVAVAVATAGCSPRNEFVDGGIEDLSQTRRDLQSCEPLPGNLLGNPGFEQPSPSEPDGNGQASNRGNPPSTIPGGPLGPWDGCCSQATGGTRWTVTTTMPRCGARALRVVSDQAAANVLNQRLDLAAYTGRSVRASAWVFIAQAAAGAALTLDLFDLTQSRPLASSAPLNAPTADWHFLSVMGQVPTGGAVQVRLNSSGTLTAVVDDTALAPL